MKIGIMGAPIDSGNMGCMALTYSLLSCLEAVGKAENLDLSYKVFDWKYNEKKLQMLSEKLNIPKEKIEYGHYSSLNHPLKIAYHSVRTVKMIQDIRKCDCVIDLTEGDSFSDIYGDEWFRGRTKVSFGIGTFCSNDTCEKALNIVIKLQYVNGRPVAKLSDAQGKEMCRDEGKYYSYAKLNRERLNYTLLMRMALNMPYDQILKKREKDYRKLYGELRRNEKMLLRAPIPLSRKVTIALMCRNYRLVCAGGAVYRAGSDAAKKVLDGTRQLKEHKKKEHKK
jgi:hypothetical protein